MCNAAWTCKQLIESRHLYISTRRRSLVCTVAAAFAVPWSQKKFGRVHFLSLGQAVAMKNYEIPQLVPWFKHVDCNGQTKKSIFFFFFVCQRRCQLPAENWAVGLGPQQRVLLVLILMMCHTLLQDSICYTHVHVWEVHNCSDGSVLDWTLLVDGTWERRTFLWPKMVNIHAESGVKEPRYLQNDLPRNHQLDIVSKPMSRSFYFSFSWPRICTSRIGDSPPNCQQLPARMWLVWLMLIVPLSFLNQFCEVPPVGFWPSGYHWRAIRLLRWSLPLRAFGRASGWMTWHCLLKCQDRSGSNGGPCASVCFSWIWLIKLLLLQRVSSLIDW